MYLKVGREKTLFFTRYTSTQRTYTAIFIAVLFKKLQILNKFPITQCSTNLYYTSNMLNYIYESFMQLFFCSIPEQTLNLSFCFV